MRRLCPSSLLPGAPRPRAQLSHHVSRAPLAHPPAGARGVVSATSRPRTALFFPGQGVQKVGMLSPWLEAFPRTVRPTMDEIDTLVGYNMTRIIEEGSNRELTATELAQPAIMATSILILRVLENEFGFRPRDRVDVTLGHSLGEFAALVAGGYVSFPDSLYLVRKRAEAMAEATRRAASEHGGEYGMIALVTEPNHLGPLITTIHEFLDLNTPGLKADTMADLPPIDQVQIANINSNSQIVLSGSIERIRTLLTHLRQFAGHDPRAVRLKTETPFHSPLMQPAVTLMRKLLDGKSRVKGHEDQDIVKFPGIMQCISNVTAKPFSSKDELKELWARQATETVRWWSSIKYLDKEQRVRRWIGIGPGMVGRNLVGKEVGMRGKDLVKGGGVWAIADPKDIEEVLKGLEETENIMEDMEDSPFCD